MCLNCSSYRSQEISKGQWGMDFKGRGYHMNGVKEGGGIMEQKMIGSIGEGTLKSFEKDIMET